MGVKDMPCVTVEQVLRLRDYAAEVEAGREQLREALIAIQTDGAWIGGGWVPSEEAELLADAALKATEDK